MDDPELLARARGGARDAFDGLAAPHLGRLRAFALRMVMQPQDAEDLVQDALLQAFTNVRTFRGEARFSTWLFAILARRCVDHLRSRRRWPVSAQTTASDEHVASPRLMAELQEAASAPGFSYDFREHVAYCFSCIGRSLEPRLPVAPVG